MNRLFSILILLTCFAAQATPFYLVSLNPDQSPNTNQVIFTPYPPGKPFYIYGTNIVTGFNPITNTPNSGGFFSNSVLPLTFAVTYANSPASQPGYFVSITDSTNYLPLTTYITTLPVVAAAYGSSFGFITNQLGYWPATNGIAGMLAALGFQPATNSLGCITNLLGGTPSLATFASIIAALGYTPPTNNYSSITNSVGFAPATNTPSGIAAAQGFLSATNTPAGIVAALNFQPSTNTPAFTTTSNPTNQYVTGILYTNTARKGWLRGFAFGGILNHTNGMSGLQYNEPVTNNFMELISTNDTFQFTGGNITNTILWQ